ncbi:MAG: SMP-30/gluconolactonase/LRE family protein [Lysobacterales bacterium]
MAFVQKTEFELIASGLGYPEGPIYEPDGSILLVELLEIKDERLPGLTRVKPDGSVQRIVDIKGGPNGAAFGKDGQVYIANSGGFDWLPIPLDPEGKKVMYLGTTEPESYEGGRIERVDISSAAPQVEDLYRTCYKGFDNMGFGKRKPKEVKDFKPVGLRGPDDLVFDKSGGFWISDFGKQRPRNADVTGIYYATADGQNITEMIYPLAAPNGIGLSPKEDRLYATLTYARQVVYWKLDKDSPGTIIPNPNTMDGSWLLTAKLPGQAILDSMAVDEDGNVYVAIMLPKGNTPFSNGGIAVISPDGESIDFMEINIEGEFAPLPSNLCFGGPDRKTLYVTCGASGLLAKADVVIPGLALNNNPYS